MIALALWFFSRVRVGSPLAGAVRSARKRAAYVRR